MVELLQPIELLHPLLQRESAQRRYFYRLVEPIVRLAGTKVENTRRLSPAAHHARDVAIRRELLSV